MTMLSANFAHELAEEMERQMEEQNSLSEDT